MFQYRLYLIKKALSAPAYTLPSGFATAGSLLAYLVEPNLPLFGLLITAAGMYAGLEAAVLRFPAALRPRFRAWFGRYHRLLAQNPANSGIDLSGSPVNPEFILSRLFQIKQAKLGDSLFQQFADEIDTAFQSMESKIQEARTTHDVKRLQQISREIHAETQRVTRSADAYKDAMASIYDADEDLAANRPEEQNAFQEQGITDRSAAANIPASPPLTSQPSPESKAQQQLQQRDE